MAYRSIVLSGNPKSGKSALADQISERYEWPTRSIGGMWKEKHRQLYPNGEVPFEEYWANTTREENLRVNVEAKLLFESGGIVADSRFVSYLDPAICLLIFVTSDLDTRAVRAWRDQKDYKGKSIEEVKAILERREMDEVRIGKDLFGIDYRDPRQYHLVINSGALTVQQEVAIVASLIEARRRD